jgi:hypothetical protein
MTAEITATIDRIVIHDLYIRNPPRWFRRIGNGPWEPVDLSLFGGKLPVVWLRPVDYLITETLETSRDNSANL